MLNTQEVSACLRNHGFKVTPQRLAVYNALSRTKAHPNAETLYKTLQPYYPTMSLATVYKALSILCEVGLAQELNTGEDAFRYDADVHPHPHIRCIKCGRVDDVPDLPENTLETQVGNATGYQMAGHQYYFFGVCPECQKKMTMH